MLIWSKAFLSLSNYGKWMHFICHPVFGQIRSNLQPEFYIMWLSKPVCSWSVVSSSCGGEKLILSVVSCPWPFPLIHLVLTFLFGRSIKVEVIQHLKTYWRSRAGSSHIPLIILYIPFLILTLRADFSWLTHIWSNSILVCDWGPRMVLTNVMHLIQFFFYDWINHFTDTINLIH